MFQSIYKVFATSIIISGIIPSVAAKPIDVTVMDISNELSINRKIKTSGIGQFMPDGISYLKSNDDHTTIIRYDLLSGKELETVFDASHTRESSISSFDSFAISPDGSKLIIATNTKSVYRRSKTSVYYVFNIKRNILTPLSKSCTSQQSPEFSSDGRMVAFVAGGNVYLRNLDYDTELKITEDGKAGNIINGATDWTYEEEFEITSTLRFSPDGENLCFVTFDESQVPTYSFSYYPEVPSKATSPESLYPYEHVYKYPVAGANNSSVTVKAYNIAKRTLKELPVGTNAPYYIPRIDFAPGNNNLFVTTLDRSQRRMEIFSVNPQSTISKSVVVEESNCWLLPATYEDVVYTESSILIQSSRSGFNNIYEYSHTGSLIKNVTPINRDVTDFYGKDAAGNYYYQAISDSPINGAVYRADKKNCETPLSEVSRTCSARFTPGCAYFVLTTQDAATPPFYSLYATAANKKIRVLETNENIYSDYWHQDIREYMNKIEFFTIPSDGVELNAYIIKPKDFDSAKKYPVIIDQYSGPGSQSVLNKWSYTWEQYAVNNGYIVVSVDPRGTGGRGRAFMDVVYRNLGHYETIDLVNSARYLASLPYVDASRIGIEGWSYGGYEALMCGTHADKNPFAAVVAIAPVTDWRLYDTVYTERYMLTPQENEDGYLASSPICRVSDLEPNTLVISGTADDNVHYYNTLAFMQATQSNGNLIDMYLFPNMDHSINGTSVIRAMVYAKMLQHFDRVLKR